MILVLIAVGAMLLVLPGRRGNPPRHLPLGEWVPLAMAAMVAGGLAIVTGLTFIALPAISHSLGVSELLDSCHDVLAPFGHDPTPIGWLAFVALLAFVARLCIGALRSHRRARAARAEPWLGTHARFGDFELVVLPTPELLAYGVPGRPVQVVVSEGLAGQLEPAAFEALLLHEAAHHRLHHPRYLAALAAIDHAFGAFPAIRRSTLVIREALEAWADASATAGDAATPSLCRALTTGPEVTPAVVERLDRLARPAAVRPPAVRAMAYAPTSALAVASAALAIGWTTNAHLLLSLGSHCA